ncbi:MAG: UvrD-helicase domain-containing protein [Deltaproteobacteria bacterium]|nr:UvrD-helicase domain-containing protein [Deltaproteobacteria bacterium]
MSANNGQLNPPQAQAVAHQDGPLLVLAGAGSGKTRVITQRIARLVDEGLDPRRILAVTFTNKAAREMRERAERLIARRIAGLWIGTFHSICARLLRRYGDAVGLSPSYVIYDDGDQRTLMRQVMRQEAISERLFAPRDVLSHIDRAKNAGTSAEQYQAHDYFSDIVARLYPAYQRQLQRCDAADFGDLLLKTVQLLRADEALRQHLSSSFEQVLVDEFQDTNPVQYELIRLLSSTHNNICVVGDDDQSIYRWRGAQIENILGFERDHPGAQVIKLEQNYRSSQVVLDAAHAVISRNAQRKAKQLWTDQQGGEPITLCVAPDERTEARFVASRIHQLVAQAGHTFDDVAIFYRTHAQSRAIEEALRAASPPIPYAVYGGMRFYDRAEIKDLLCYLKLLINPADDVALQRVINVPARGIGKTTVEKLIGHASAHGISLLDAARAAATSDGPLGGAARRKVGDFVKLIDALAEGVSETLPSTLAERVLDDSGYLQSLAQSGTVEATTRAENLSELVSSIRQFEAATEEATLVSYLEQVSLATDVTDQTNEQGQVSLMTVHSAKGLEFPTVFVIGLEQGIFPHARSLDAPEELEEERRLAYVAITRTKRRLFLSRAMQRWHLGQLKARPPSEFLSDIPEQLIGERAGLHAAPARRNAPARLPAFAGAHLDQPEPTYDDAWVDDEFDQSAPDFDDLFDADGFRVGMRVKHRKFGVGEIRSLTGTAPNLNLTVYFKTVGAKTIRSQFVEPL